MSNLSYSSNSREQSILKIGQGSELDIAQKKTNDQQVYEKTFNITNDQEMQVKTTMRYHLTPTRMTVIKQKIKGVDQDVEKKGTLNTVGGNVNSYDHYGQTLWKILKKLKIGVGIKMVA